MKKLEDQTVQSRKKIECHRCHSPGVADRAVALRNLADSVRKRFKETNAVADLDEAIALDRSALDLLPVGHPDRHGLFHWLAWCLLHRYRKQGTLPDLEEAITLGRAALALCQAGHPNRVDSLDNLAVYLCDRYIKQDCIADLEESINLSRTALKLHPPRNPDRAWTFSNLAGALRRRFLALGANADLEEAISLDRLALDLCPEGHPDRSSLLNDLAVCLSIRYEKRASISDLGDAITLGQSALDLCPSGHSGRALFLNNLGEFRRHRFLELGFTADLKVAISLLRSALDLRPEGHPDRSDALHSLSLCFSDRYDTQGSIADLEEAITLGQAALDLRPSDHFGRIDTLNNLADNLRRRFLKLGANADLEEAILLLRSALDLRLEGHPDRSFSLHRLALCLSDWYNKQTSVADWEEDITVGQAALDLRRPGKTDPAVVLSSLGYYLRRRFLKVGVDADLDAAISFHRSALDLRPVEHPDRLMSLNQLVSCLTLRFEKLGAPADMDDLINLNRAILDLRLPGYRGRVKPINNLLLLLHKRFKRLGMIADLDERLVLWCLALGLRKPEDPDHARCFRYLVADLQRILRKLEIAPDIHDSSDHTTSLHNLVVCVWKVVSRGHVSADANRIVAIVRAALGLCPLGHSDRNMVLTTLATSLQYRFRQQGAIMDLEEAIILYKEILERCPPERADSAAPLHNLAWCLSQRFIKLSMRSDLDDAIKFELAASTLYPPGHPDHIKSLDSLSNHLQMRIKGRNSDLPPARPASPNVTLQIKQRIRDVVLEVLKVYPPRLLYTPNGMLCDRNSQISHFESSHGFNQLMLSALTSDNSLPVTHIRATVSTYFRYVTLSHRWGNSEPLLRNIEGRAIYDLDTTDGLSKLQSFCLASCRQGFPWAWSDTCCIDKESSAELQEAIGSMFSWYRQSALTIVHLADVSGTGALTSSVWFKRGWTLQELLAPRFLLFFTRDWSLYRGISSNHKENNIILGELEQATGIASHHLTNFYPGADNAQSRLQWASTRFTTRPEDISYSLFGVFGLHIPVLYGESVGNALGRLLAEVISKSGDTSILDWVGQSSAFHSCFPATITSYQILPPQAPDFITPPNVRSIWNFLNFRSVRKMHQALSNLPLTQFINFRLILPCIIHCIKTIFLVRIDSSTGAFVYHIRAATGLEPIEIAISQALEDLSEQVVPYVLIRPWHFNLLGSSVMRNATSAQRWLTKMQQPFSALLLKELPQNEYKRVASFCHILARPMGAAGVLKGEVTTLTIV